MSGSRVTTCYRNSIGDQCARRYELEKRSFRKGYFMSAQEQRVQMALLLLDHNETKERLALLRYKAGEIAGALEGVVKSLKECPEDIELHEDGLVLKNYMNFGALVEDFKKTITELQKLDATLTEAGIRH